MQATKCDLWAKVAALERAHQEALEAGNTVECLTEELGRLRMYLERQEALVSRRGKVIAELRDEACTQWAFGWLVFQRRASRAFPCLNFNIQLSDEEVEEFVSETEADTSVEVLPGAPARAPLSTDLQVPPKASSSDQPASAGQGPSSST